MTRGRPGLGIAVGGWAAPRCRYILGNSAHWLRGGCILSNMRYADCHPERKHKALGLCEYCYEHSRGQRRKGTATDRHLQARPWDRHSIDRDRDKKIRLQQLLGGQCVDCGLDDPDVLEFDHIDPTVKTFTIGPNLRIAWADLEIEAYKCVLRCANCHRRRTRQQNMAAYENSRRNRTNLTL